VSGALPLIGLEEAAVLLRGKRRVALSTHLNPDGDAIGSACALALALRGLGADARVILADALPENLRFLDVPAGLVERYDPAAHDAVIGGADAVLLPDLNALHRIGAVADAVEASSAPRMVIDHHLEPKPFAQAYLVNTDACATAEIVFDLLATMAVPLTRDIAVALYAGIMTDTGSFRFDRTTPRVHRIAAALLEAGADPTDVYRRVYDEYPLRRTQLLGKILATLEPVAGGRATLLQVTRTMLADTGTTLEDVENVVNYGLSVRGVELTVLLTELEDGVKFSFRSRGNATVLALAARFNGGGHAQASGATVRGIGLDEALEQVRQALTRDIGE
jgi:bifunctional oligoribonuclease and PAP phosphatase NrnA